MAGHSKWANIQHRKGAQDKRRGKLFTKLIREIMTAARLGNDSRLRLAVDKALAGNMTRDTIDRAIKRGSGSDEAANMEEIRYEGYGPGGVAILVDCLSDNRNRTVAEVRHAFNKCGGNLGTDGSVAYLFAKRGVLSFAPGAPEDRLLEIALEAGADDVVSYDDQAIDVFTSSESFESVRDALSQAGWTPDLAELAMVPSVKAEIDEETQQKLDKLIDMLEDLDDVQNVYSNVDA